MQNNICVQYLLFFILSEHLTGGFVDFDVHGFYQIFEKQPEKNKNIIHYY